MLPLLALGLARGLPRGTPFRAPADRALAIGMLALLAAPGCTVPLTLEAGRPAPALDRFPAGTTQVERAAADGVVLRGVHVPAAPARALVLHLLPRGASSAGHPFLAGFRETLQTLQEDGFASLAMDYRGIGRSDDPLDAAALPLDAAVMLRTARETADGAPLVVRACSLGSLAWAAAADDVEAPAALVLVVPVDSATVAGNGFRRLYGGFLGTLLSWFHADPDVPDLRTTLEDHPVPTLLLLAEEDPLLPPDERAQLLRALPEHVEVHVLPGTHEEVATRLLGFAMGAEGGAVTPQLFPEERRFLDRVLAREAPEPRVHGAQVDPLWSADGATMSYAWPDADGKAAGAWSRSPTAASARCGCASSSGTSGRRASRSADQGWPTRS